MTNAGPAWRQPWSPRSPLPLPNGHGSRLPGLHDCYRARMDVGDGVGTPGPGVGRPPARPAGSILAIVAGLLLMLALCGWLIICTGLIASGSRPDDAEGRRDTQLSDVNSTIRDLDSKLGTLSDKLERIGDMALENIHGSDSRTERLNRLESQVQQLRQRASGMDPGKGACGAAAAGGAVESVPAGERR